MVLKLHLCSNTFYMSYSNLHKLLSPTLLILLVGSLLFTACTNEGSTKDGKDSASTNTTSATAKTWTQEDELEFMNGCVDNAKARLSNEKAYAYCKCVLAQVKTKYAMDSTIIAKLSDTAEVAKMAQNCE